MAIFRWFELRPGNASEDEKGIRTYTRRFFIQMDDWLEVPPDTWGFGGPEILRYDPYPYYIQATARSLECTAIGDSLGMYEVAVTYKSGPFDRGNTSGDPSHTDQSTPPPSRPWVVKFGSTHGTRILAPYDLSPTPQAVMNSAGQPYNPPIEVPSSNQTIIITAYAVFGESFDPVANNLKFVDSINSVALTIPNVSTQVYPVGSLRCNEYNPGIEFENGAPYYKIDVTCEYKVIGWAQQVLDAGTMYLKSNSLPPQPILDTQGNPVQQPVPLNGAGMPLNAGQPLVYKTYQPYFYQDFTQLFS